MKHSSRAFLGSGIRQVPKPSWMVALWRFSNSQVEQVRNALVGYSAVLSSKSLLVLLPPLPDCESIALDHLPFTKNCHEPHG